MPSSRFPYPAPIAAWMAWADFGMKMTETLLASSSVVARRSEILTQAAASPLTADHREILRMSSEKTRAFSQALMQLGLGGFTALAAAQAAWFGSGASAMQRALGDSGRNARLARRVLAPVHSTATANAKRLSRRRAATR